MQRFAYAGLQTDLLNIEVIPDKASLTRLTKTQIRVSLRPLRLCGEKN